MSEPWGRPFPPRAKPRKVEGGLKARSTRGAIGETWWSRRFIAVLESLEIGGRLVRGRAYARKGQVLSLDVAPGTVTAAVQGSAVKPYRVTIGLAPFPPRAWSKVEVALSEQALYSAQLLAGEMPHEIEEVFAAVGKPLFPSNSGELTFSCTCPDPVRPCKHIAASLYLLAEAFDTDPFQILHWRGRDRQTLLARLRTLRSGDAAAAQSSHDRPVLGTAVALADLNLAPVDEAVDRFWLPPVPLPAPPATLDTEPDLLLRQLPPPGSALGGPTLIDHMRSLYARFGTIGQ